MRVVNEPAAAAIAYAHELKLKSNNDIENTAKTILIFDFGGGTLDISIIDITMDKKVRVKNSDGDSNLGGQDIDNALIAFFIEKI